MTGSITNNLSSPATGLAGLGAGGGGATGVDAAMSRRQDDFTSVIARAKNGVGGPGAGDRAKTARDAAEQFIATALVQPILSQLRSTNQAAAPFAPTSGERSFQQMADAQTAIGFVRKSHWSFVDRIADAIERRSAVATPTTGTKGVTA